MTKPELEKKADNITIEQVKAYLDTIKEEVDAGTPIQQAINLALMSAKGAGIRYRLHPKSNGQTRK